MFYVFAFPLTFIIFSLFILQFVIAMMFFNVSTETFLSPAQGQQIEMSENQYLNTGHLLYFIH